MKVKNNLYLIKNKVYFIIKDTGRPGDPRMSIGFMRQINEPWLTGRGLQLRLGKNFIQVGLCGNPQNLDNQNGLLYAMQGRLMDTNPDEIGDW